MLEVVIEQSVSTGGYEYIRSNAYRVNFSVPGSHREWNMPQQNKDKSISDEFFWEIPGDVPGKRAQDDPFQSARSAPDPDYQVLPQQLTWQPSNNSNVVPVSSPQAEPGSNHVSISDVSNSKPFKWLPLLLIVLFVMGLGGVSYQHFMTSPDKLLVINTTAPTLAIKQPKIFELFLGEKNKTAQSKLRIITHVVVKGDTLWDIAETYVKDPFRYPELAELSKIKNPDLIYPYELVRIHI